MTVKTVLRMFIALTPDCHPPVEWSASWETLAGFRQGSSAWHQHLQTNKQTNKGSILSIITCDEITQIIA